MPELPEVENVRLSLTELKEKEIVSCYLSRLAPVRLIPPAIIRQSIVGREIKNIERWGKYLIFRSDSQLSLIVHLGMSGQLTFNHKINNSRKAHTHMQIKFDDDSELVFVDPRRFGMLMLSQQSNLADNRYLSYLGPDYLDQELSVDVFVFRMSRHAKLNVKAALLNQKIASGLGNIYACETLYDSRISPQRQVASLTEEELLRLFASAQRILKLGIQWGGTTLKDYVNGLGAQGEMKKFLQVYGRKDQMTLDGRGKVKSMIQQGRNTWFCPELQR